MATQEQALGFIKEIAPIMQDVCKRREGVLCGTKSYSCTFWGSC